MLLKYVFIIVFSINEIGVILISALVYFRSTLPLLPLVATIFFALSLASIFVLVWVLKKYPSKLDNHYERLYMQKQKLLINTRRKNITRVSGMIEEIRSESHKTILKLYENIFQEEWEVAKNQREKLEEIYQNLSIKSFCDNDIVNAAIYPKYQYCKKQNIIFSISFTEFNGIKIDELLLVCVLTNLLDNGIEAAEKVQNKKYSYIRLSVTQKSGFLFLHFENSKLPTDTVKKNITTKRDKSAHGYGLQIIEEIVNQYDGRCKIIESPDVVIFDIALRNIKEIQKKGRKANGYLHL